MRSIMSSIGSKLSLAVVCCTLAAALLVGAISIHTVKEEKYEDTKQILQLTCSNEARRIDAELLRIEEPVELMAQYASTCLSDESRTPEERINRFRDVCLNAGLYTDDALAVYYHVNVEEGNSDNDFLFVRNRKTGTFYERETGDPRAYEERTGKTANWYFASADSGKSCWLGPYRGSTEGENFAVETYTVPVFSESQELLGVLGMDFSLDVLTDIVKNIRLYKTGYGFIVDAQSKVFYHPTLEYGTTLTPHEPKLAELIEKMEEGAISQELREYTHQGVKKVLYFAVMRNGMRLAVTVPAKELYEALHRMVGQLYILMMIVIVVSAVFIFCIVYRLVRPLILLDRATTQIISGDMRVDIPYHSKDEIGKLADNFRRMADVLQKHIAYVNQLAYQDAMTGVKNKAAYESAVWRLESRREQGFTDFGVIVFDLNNLKRVNDTLGHEAGDLLIKNASFVICKAFAHSPVFRVGGDEFVVLLENEDLQRCGECLDLMDTITREMNQTLPDAEKVSIARGFARFDAEQEHTYAELFQRADREMYDNKAQMKQKAPELMRAAECKAPCQEG